MRESNMSSIVENAFRHIRVNMLKLLYKLLCKTDDDTAKMVDTV